MLADTQNTQDTQAAPAETTPTDPRRRYLCRHVFADGHRCGSPALRQRNFCFYHHAGRRPAPGPGKFRYLDATEPFTLPLVEDRVSALLAASLILSRIASNDLDHNRAGRLIADLRVIATLLPREPRLTAAAADAAAAAAKQSAASRQPPVEDLILDEAHGLIAPIAELPEPNPADPLQNCHPERSSAFAPNAVEGPAVASPTADPLQNCHPERSSASAPNAVEGPAVASPTADPLQNCHPERSSASAPNAVEGPAVASHTADPLQNCHPERSSASAPNAVEGPAVASHTADPLQNCHPERSSASAPNAVEGPAVASHPADPLQNCHPERSSASAPNAVEGPAVASPTVTNPRTSPRAPKRVYTDEEKDFLKCTTSSTHYAPVHRPRPESITDDDIIAAINALRRRCSLGVPRSGWVDEVGG